MTLNPTPARRVPPPELGPMLATARLRAGLRLRECARLLQVNPGYLVHLESGHRVPSVTVANRIADALALDDGERAALLDVAVDDAGADHPWKRPARPESLTPHVVLGQHPTVS